MLERVLGAGRVRAEVAMEMDFDRVETREERFDPDNQVARSTQSTTENNRTQEPGTVSVGNNLPGAEPPAAATATPRASRRRRPTTRSAAPPATCCASIRWCAA
jgi:flagellar M-ring protein FliF